MEPSVRRGRAAAVERVGDDALADLRPQLSAAGPDDPYARSVGYFALTGRDGLYQVRRGASCVLFCRHPNRADTILVFPPLGPEGNQLLVAAVQAAGRLGGEVRLARQPEGRPPPIPAEPVAEEVLDWRYPVHVLDCRSVIEHRGRRFKNLRTALNGLDPSRLQAVDIDPLAHRCAVLEVVLAWAREGAGKISPYIRQLDLLDMLPLAGRVIFYDGVPAGFSIWEETDPAAGIANAFASIGLRDVRDMSRFVIMDMCRTLAARGFARVCLGGSETQGLDQYKRMFRPIMSIRLMSYRVQIPAAARRL